MSSTGKTQVSKDLNEKSILVTRKFNAPLASVWRAYSESELLDQWWGPQPWKAKTKHMDFSEGGYWLYAMVGPDGTTHWGRMNYRTITPKTIIAGEDVFCDENGNINPDLPVSQWVNTFTESSTGTVVEHKLTFETVEGLQAMVDMGFAEGISLGHDQLEELLTKI